MLWLVHPNALFGVRGPALDALCWVSTVRKVIGFGDIDMRRVSCVTKMQMLTS